MSSGPVDIVASGTVISFKGNPVEVAFRALANPLDLTPALPIATLPFATTVVPPTAGFKFIFRFQDDSKTPESPPLAATIEAKTVETYVLEITLRNFLSPLGGGNTEPIRVGKAFNRPLYLSYRVHHLQGGDKTLTFAIYQDRMQEASILGPETTESSKPNA